MRCCVEGKPSDGREGNLSESELNLAMGSNATLAAHPVEPVSTGSLPQRHVMQNEYNINICRRLIFFSAVLIINNVSKGCVTEL